MNIHEFQAKQLFRDYGIPVPKGAPAASVQEAASAASHLGGGAWMVKAQVHAGGRGKAGGVHRVVSMDELRAVADRMLATHLVTHQTTAAGQPVNAVLIEETCAIARELYVGVVVDRARERVVIMASAEGGMEIEHVAAESPEKILTAVVHPVAGLQPYQCRQLAFGLQLTGTQIGAFTRILLALYRLFTEKDASLIEINPLVTTSDGELLALDAKINFDDNALYRHAELSALRDATQEDEKEHQAQQHGLNYVSLDGDIGCLVNGAGLAMATMDLIKLHGGEPANFLDVGGGTTADKVAEAFKLILAEPRVKAILVNIFGGIVRCDLIAEGIISAVRDTGIAIPVVIRLEGTNAERGRELLEQSGLELIAAADLAQAAAEAVEAAHGTAGV